MSYHPDARAKEQVRFTNIDQKDLLFISICRSAMAIQWGRVRQADRCLVTEDEHAVLLLVVAVCDDVLHELCVFSEVVGVVVML